MTSESSNSYAEIDRRLAALMREAQGGQREAYDLLLRTCIPIIATMARKTGARPECVDDAVQETLMTLHRARHTYDPGRSFVAWLSVLAQRRTVDVLRRHGRNRAREVHAPAAYESYTAATPNPEDLLTEASRQAVLREAMQALPPAQREAVQHLAVHDRSLTEASLATGRSKVALKVNLHRAVAALRLRLLGDRQ